MQLALEAPAIYMSVGTPTENRAIYELCVDKLASLEEMEDSPPIEAAIADTNSGSSSYFLHRLRSSNKIMKYTTRANPNPLYVFYPSSLPSPWTQP